VTDCAARARTSESLAPTNAIAVLHAASLPKQRLGIATAV
jgi:hypothetical protein